MDRNRSLFEAYLQGMADLVIWLFPIAITGVVMVLVQRTVLPPPSSNRGENQ